jgi:hypothetical protein
LGGPPGWITRGWTIAFGRDGRNSEMAGKSPEKDTSTAVFPSLTWCLQKNPENLVKLVWCSFSLPFWDRANTSWLILWGESRMGALEQKWYGCFQAFDSFIPACPEEMLIAPMEPQWGMLCIPGSGRNPYFILYWSLNGGEPSRNRWRFC